MKLSLAQRIFDTKQPFVLFHTHAATSEVIKAAIAGRKSIDLDISIDESGDPYLGHSKEYYEKSGKTQPETMPFWPAIDLIAQANIPAIVDCKHYDAWPVVEEVISRIGAHRCLVHTFATELKFDHDKSDHDYLTEWSAIKKLRSIKEQFPSVSTTASCKFLPQDLLISERHEELLSEIRTIFSDNMIDRACLNVPHHTVTDEVIDFFLAKKILPNIGVDRADVSKLSKLYIGEADDLALTSDSKLLGY